MQISWVANEYLILDAWLAHAHFKIKYLSKKSANTVTGVSVIVKDLKPSCHLSFDFYDMCCSRHGEEIYMY